MYVLIIGLNFKSITRESLKMKTKLILMMALLSQAILATDTSKSNEEESFKSSTFRLFKFDEEYLREEAFIKERVEELNNYYNSQCMLKKNEILKKVNELVDPNERSSYFADCIESNKTIENTVVFIYYLSLVGIQLAESYNESPFEYNQKETFKFLTDFQSVVKRYEEMYFIMTNRRVF